MLISEQRTQKSSTGVLSPRFDETEFRFGGVSPPSSSPNCTYNDLRGSMDTQIVNVKAAFRATMRRDLNQHGRRGYALDMEASVTFKSAQDGTTLKLFERGGGYFLARVIGPNFQATAKVYEYEPEYLKRFFADLAANWKSWKGKKEWQSLEGELAFCAAIDLTGHISLSIQLRSGSYPFDWKLSALILLEAGQLDRLTYSVAAFLKDANVG